MSSFFVDLRHYLKRNWQVVALYALLFLSLSILLVSRLDTLTPGYSAGEQASYTTASSLRGIWENPLNAPYSLVVHAFGYITSDSLLATRLASTSIAWITIVLFCIVLYLWHGTRTAILGTLIFGTSSWFLHIARLGTPEVVLFGLFALVACGIWLRERQAGWAIFLGLSLSGLLLYTPGMVWLIGLGILWQLPTIDRIFKANPGAVFAGSAIFLLIIAPLVWHFYQHPSVITDWLYLPDNWKDPLHFITNILHVPLSFFVRQPAENPELWLGRLPVFSIFATVMFIFGAFVYWKYAKLARVKIIAGLAVISSVIIGLSDHQLGISVLVPFGYLVVAAGIGYLVDQWYSVFPRNPIAKSLGGVIIGLLVATAVLYSTRSYFIAWPQSTETREVFNINNR